MSDVEIILIIFAICLIFAVIVIICSVIIYNKHLKIVKDNSEYYAEILKLNGSYVFYNLPSTYKYYENCPSKRKLENLSLADVLLSRIDFNFAFYENLLLQVQKNRQNYELYCRNYNNLCSMITEDRIKELKIKLKTFRKIEKNLCTKIKLKPQLSTKIYISANYTSPKGRKSYSKERTFTYNEIVSVFNQYITLKKQKREYSYQVKMERAKMSDSLRYDILRRDNFRCQLCGATAQEGAKLHVDHIVPVAKGGRTISSNLRTLCDRCNMGKSDKIE